MESDKYWRTVGRPHNVEPALPEIPDLAQLHSFMAAKGFVAQGNPVREQDHWQWFCLYGSVPVDTCTWTRGRKHASACLYDGRGHAIVGWTYLDNQWIEDKFNFVGAWLVGEDF